MSITYRYCTWALPLARLLNKTCGVAGVSTSLHTTLHRHTYLRAGTHLGVAHWEKRLKMQLVGQRPLARAHVSGGPPTLRLGAGVPRRQGTSSAGLIVRSTDASTAASSALADPVPTSSPEPIAATAPPSSDAELKRPEQRKPPRNNGAARSDSRKPRPESGAAVKSSRLSKDDRQFIAQRRDALIKGEAVGIVMQPTVADVATGFRGLRPLSSELARRDRTLLFFPTSSRPQPQPEEAAADAPKEQAPAATAVDASEQKDKQQQQQQPKQPRNLELALVAVTKFEAPQPEVTIRVGAR